MLGYSGTCEQQNGVCPEVGMYPFTGNSKRELDFGVGITINHHKP